MRWASADVSHTRSAVDVHFGSHSRTAPERRPTYVYCMEINNWPPYSSFDELSGGSIMSVWARTAAFGRQWRRPRSPASRSTSLLQHEYLRKRYELQFHIFSKLSHIKSAAIACRNQHRSDVWAGPSKCTQQGYIEGGRKCVLFPVNG